MRFHPIQLAALAAGALIASPALAGDDYPLPALSESGAPSAQAGADSEWQAAGDAEGDIVYMDDLDEGEEWHSDDSGKRRIRKVIERETVPQPGLPPQPGARPLGYGEAEREAWLAECRARISGSRQYGADPCGDYLARYEAGIGGAFGHDYAYGRGYGRDASYGCGGGCGCNAGCGCGGCSCRVSYHFAPIPVMPVVQPQPKKITRTITTEEWVEEERPGKVVKARPAPAKPVPVKQAPARPAKPRSTK